MSDHDKKTEALKALLRQKLEGLPPAEDGWNVPSPGVWKGLSEELGANAQPKPSKNWVARLATITAALMVILCWRECSNQHQLMGLKSEVEKASIAYEKLKEACNERQSSAQTALTGDTDQYANSNLKKSEVPAILSQKDKPKPKQISPITAIYKLPKNSTTVGNTSAELENTAIAPSDAPAAQFGNQMMESLAAKGSIQQHQGLLDFLPFRSMVNFDYPPKSPMLDLQLPNPKDQGASVQLIASLLGGLALTGNQLSGQKPAIIKDQKALFAWRSGFGLEAAFNRHWSVLSGVEYGHSRIETDYQLAVPYTHTGEFQHDDGNFDNQYNHSLPSSLGNYPAQFVLTRTNNLQVAEGEVMNLDLSIRQNTRFLSLPLQLRYGFGKERWQLGAKAGIIANHVLGIASEKPTLHSNHGAIHERHTAIGTPPLNNLEQWTFDYTLSIDFRYQLSPRFGLSIASAFQKGFTPVYKDALVKNYLNAWNLGAGVHYWLR
jgi:hypothetical protein